MPNRDILPVSGVKQGLFTARPTPRLEYEVADARYNSLTPPGRVSGSTHPHLRGNERNLAHRPHTTRKSMGCSVCHTSRSESYPGRGRIQVYIPPPQVVLKIYPHTDIETSNTTIAIRPSARFRTCLRTSIHNISSLLLLPTTQ